MTRDSQEWRIIDPGAEHPGPFSRSEIASMADVGSVTADTLIQSLDDNRKLTVSILLTENASPGARSQVWLWGAAGALAVALLLVGGLLVMGRSPDKPPPVTAAADAPAAAPPAAANDRTPATTAAPKTAVALPAATTGTPPTVASPPSAIAALPPGPVTTWRPFPTRIATAIGTPDAFAVCALRKEDHKRLHIPSYDHNRLESPVALLVRFPDTTTLAQVESKFGGPQVELITEFANLGVARVATEPGPLAFPRDGHPLDGLVSENGGLSELAKHKSERAFILIFLVPRWVATGDLMVAPSVDSPAPVISLPLSWESSVVAEPLAANDWSLVTLPERYDAVAQAAGGSLLVFHPSGANLLRIYDVQERRLVRALPIPARDVVLGAGTTCAVICDRVTRKLLTVRLGDGKITSRIDLPIPEAPDLIEVAASDDQVRLLSFVPHTDSRQPGIQCDVVTVALDSGKAGAPQRIGIAAKQKHGREDDDDDRFAPRVVAVDSPTILLSVSEQGQLSLKDPALGDYPEQIGFFPGPVASKMHSRAFRPAWMQDGVLHCETVPVQRRLLLSVGKGWLCCLPLTDRHVMHRAFDREALLKKKYGDRIELDHMIDARAGSRLEHQLVQKSRWSEATWSLIKGPPGMALSPTGLLTWDAPDPAPKKSVMHNLTILVSPKGGKESTEYLQVRVIEAQRYDADVTSRARMQESPTARKPTADPSAERWKFQVPVTDVVRDGELLLTDNHIDVAPSRDKSLTLVLHYDRLYHFDAAGIKLLKTIRLARPYERIVDRGEYLIAQRTGGIDLIDRNSGQLRRAIDLPGGIIDMAVNPQQALTYVSFLDVSEDVHDVASSLRIATVRESDGRVQRVPEGFGSRLAITQDGKLLFTILEGACTNDFPLIKTLSLRPKPSDQVQHIRQLIAYRVDGDGLKAVQSTGNLDCHPSHFPLLRITPDGQRLVLTGVGARISAPGAPVQRSASGILSWNTGAVTELPHLIAQGEPWYLGDPVFVPGAGVLRMDPKKHALIHVDLEDANAVAAAPAQEDADRRVKGHFLTADGQGVLVLELRGRYEGTANWILRRIPLPPKQAKAAKQPQ